MTEKTVKRKDGEADKRYGKHDKPYCGKKKPSGAIEASFLVKARDGFADEEDYKTFRAFFDYKAERFHEEISGNKKTVEWALKHCNEFAKGKFYSKLAKAVNIPYKQHKTKCNNAWFYHNDAALLQRIAKGISQKIELGRICESYGWDQKKAKKINEEAHEKLGRWFYTAYIKNICQNQSYPEFPEDMSYELDFGTQSKYTIDMENWEETRSEYVEMDLLIGDYTRKRRLHFKYRVPERILLGPHVVIDIRKPKFFIDDETDELMVTIPYWYMPAELELGDGALGADAGMCRIMKGGMVFLDGKYIENLALSEETEKANAHVRNLMDNKEHLYQRYKAVERLIAHHPEPNCPDIKKLKEKNANRHEEYLKVRSNIASERQALCWMVARDLCVLVRQYGGCRIRLEDLRWVGGSGQSWNFSQLADCVEIVASRYGILVEHVNAKDSSKNQPSKANLKLKKEADSVTRTVVWSDGSIHDRDDNAGLELGCRKSKNSLSHDRDALTSVEVKDSNREFAPELPGVKPRGRRKKTAFKRRCAGRSEDLDLSYRPDLDGFYASIRERREEFHRAREAAGEAGLTWFDFVGRLPRSVVVLRKYRSVASGTLVLVAGGAPACSTGATQSLTNNEAMIIKQNTANYR